MSLIGKKMADLKVPYHLKPTLPADHFLYCEVCKNDFLNGCPKHPIRITAGRNLVVVGQSRIKNAGRGVFNSSSLAIPKNTLLGPYLGRFYSLEEYKRSGPESGFAWELLDPELKSAIGVVDPGVDPDPEVHWLAMVNTAPNDFEQNLTAIQYRGAIYYRVRKEILPHQELLTHYGDNYIKSLGIDKENFKPFVPLDSNFCPYCKKNFAILDKHMKSIHCKSNEFECYKCGNNFCNRSSLNRHVNSVHLKNKKCSNCMQRFSRKCDLMAHVKSVHLKTKYEKCPHCKVQLCENLDVHVQANHSLPFLKSLHLSKVSLLEMGFLHQRLFESALNEIEKLL